MGVAESLDPQSSLWAWVAFDLRRYRLMHGLSQPQVGKLIGAARQTVCNYEAGVRRIDDRQAAILDKEWDTGGHFLRLLTFARLNHDPEWWRQFTRYEAQATSLRIYEALLITGLLQTEDYARTLLTAGRAKGIDSLLETRMRRQEILSRENPPLLWVLLDESVLTRPVGGPSVMRGQLSRLLEVGASPNVTIRVVPTSAGAHVGLDGSFQVLSLPGRDVAYLEAQGGGRLVEADTEVKIHGVKYDRIGAKALSDDSSASLITEIMENIR